MPIAAPRLQTATIMSREYRAPGFWCVGIRSPEIAAGARPAQYVALDVPGGFAVRLPLGIYTASGTDFSLLFQEWGERTSRFANMKVGDPISCIGPLGNAFSLPAPGSRALIVAGGLGVVPFWLLARELAAARVETTIVLGARSKEHIIGEREVAVHGLAIERCTDDGSAGFRGNAVERARQLPRPDIMYGCGPPRMLRSLCEFANDAGVRCQISMEETFACSMGTCWGCVVAVRRGCAQGTGYPKAPGERRDFDFARVCTDGTVFEAADVLWRE
jgi:dihydroorotate dehydrogenase electron transfer subunit